MPSEIYKFSVDCSELLTGSDGAVSFSRLIAAYYYAVNIAGFAPGCTDRLRALREGFEFIDNFGFPPEPDRADKAVLEKITADLLRLDAKPFIGDPGAIGWMYQYFNQKTKAEAYDGLRRNVKISGRMLAPATQIFTPEWIARYLTENSIMRIAGLNGTGYYIPDAGFGSESRHAINAVPVICDPLEIKILDPCIGCGHILLAAFDVLTEVYRVRGLAPDEAALGILKRNLFGLDVDRTAVSLSRFALVMKAAMLSRHVLDAVSPLDLNIFTVQDYDGNLAELGSLIEAAAPDGAGSPAIKADAAGVLAGCYDIVVTNPPYMGNHNMSGLLSSFVRENYPRSKTDLATVFMERAFKLCKPHGIMAMINIHAWLFLPSYEGFREYLLLNKTLLSLLDLGIGAFGSGLPRTVAFVMANHHIPGYETTFAGLCADGASKESQFRDTSRRCCRTAEAFLCMPRRIIAYGADGQTQRIMKTAGRLSDYGKPRQGLKTGDNARFVRLWHEVPRNEICFDAHSREEALASGKKWFPYNKAGAYRKWYGNNRYIVNWENDGEEIRGLKTPDGRARSRAQNMGWFFKSSVSWNMVASRMSARLIPGGFIFDGAGGSIFTDYSHYILGFLNSAAAERFLGETSRSINYNVGQIAELPLILSQSRMADVCDAVADCVRISKAEWDDNEASWDFTEHPLVRLRRSVKDGILLRDICEMYIKAQRVAKADLDASERTLDTLFAEIYGFTPEDGDMRRRITQPDTNGLIKELASFAVGCMFGRYQIKKFDAVRESAISFNDAAVLFEGFICSAFGHARLADNLSFIASELGEPRAYFAKRFLSDHCKAYMKRPIYIPYGNAALTVTHTDGN